MSSEIFQLANCELEYLEVDDDHYYFGGPIGGIRQYYLGVTTVIDTAGPFPEGLRQYLRMTSFEEQKERLEMTGNRGRKLHDGLERLLQGKELSLKQDYQTTYEKDALSVFRRVMRFLQPSKIQTELIVADPDLRVAGTLDLKCIADEWKLICLLEPLKYLELDSDGDFQLKEKWLGLPDNSKRVCIIWDHKFTGRNAYSHKVQVAGYKTMHNKSQKGMRASRAFTWRYSARHKFGFDFNESTYSYSSFKRIYDVCMEYLGEFPEPPTIKHYPDTIRLYEEIETINKVKEK